MKAFLEEYGTFLVAILVGVALMGMLFAATIKNTELMQRLIPDERNMALTFLKNDETVDTSEIPVMDIAESVTVLINPYNNLDIKEFLTRKAVCRSITDSNGNAVTKTRFISLAYARDESKLQPGYLNIIGYDAVNTQAKGDYKVTYEYEDAETGYRNVHELVICVRRPYIPLEYIQAAGNHQLDTCIYPVNTAASDTTAKAATTVTIEYAPLTSARQDIIWTDVTTTGRMQFGIFIEKSGTKYYWGYAYDQKETLTNIEAVEGKKVEVTLDGIKGTFTVDKTSVEIERNLDAENNEIANTGDNYIRIFKNGQASGKLYTVKLYKGDTLMLDGFASYSKLNNTFGLWDNVSWSAFINETGQNYPPLDHSDEIEE